MGGKGNANKTDMFWSDAAAREAAYERQFEKSKGKRETTPTTILSEQKKSLSMLDILEGVTGGEILSKF